MSVELTTIIVFLTLILLIFTGIPIAFALLGIATIGYLVFVDFTIPPIYLLSAFNTTITDIFVAVPLFIFMASVLEFSGVATALYDMMYKWFAGLRGGLAMGTIIICALIAAMSGLSATGTITMGMLAYPEMRKRGYSKRMAIGSITFGGTLGPIIPPSLIMIVVGSFASLSIGKMFIGGILPGLCLTGLGSLYIAFRCWRNPDMGPSLPVEERPGWREKLVSLRGVILPIFLIIAVLGSIYGGIATPTEAAGVGALGAVVCAAIYGKLNWANLKKAGKTTLSMTSMVLFICIGGICFATLCSVSDISHFVRDLMLGIQGGPIVIVTIMFAIVFFLGMLIDSVGIVILCVPIFMPVIVQLGIDPLWFVIELTMMLVIGFITPPFGVNLFYFKGLGFKDTSMWDIYRASTPFVIIGLLICVLCAIFPEIITWLPSLM